MTKDSIPANSHALGVSLTTLISRRLTLAANFSGLIEKCELLPSCLTQFLYLPTLTPGA